MANDNLGVSVLTDQKPEKLRNQLQQLLDSYGGFAADVLQTYKVRAATLREVGCPGAAVKADMEAATISDCLIWNGDIFSQCFKEVQFVAPESCEGSWIEPGEGGADDAAVQAETIQHILVSMMRDWTDGSVTIRDLVLDPVLNRLVRVVRTTKKEQASQARIWVPSCGMGRLAVELATSLSCSVVASDESVAMLSCLSRFLTCGRLHLHPAAGCVSAGMDGPEGRARKYEISLPTKMRNALKVSSGGSVELQLRSISCASRKEEEFDAIGTLFALSKVIDMPSVVSSIARALKPGGVWVNCGPLQAHPSSEVVGFTFEELVAVAEAKGFQVLEDQRFEHVDYVPREAAAGSRDVYDVQLFVAKKPL
eukprot:gb/GFBE01004271.1/.p1 GENE.gb/GFBE01004271.1/~~gb/GFBE01004271.1/.p1  ORF type:complete len:367 (+),score=82.42 gb/GFBE01004271.1/:1-1101(+)